MGFLVLSLLSFFGHAKTIKVFCSLPDQGVANFTLVASLEVDDVNNNVATDVLVSFKEANQATPSQFITTTGHYRKLPNQKGYSYLFPVQNRSEIIHFILKMDAGLEQPSEAETTSNKKYISNCTTVE